jgi:hypothetical protein
MQETHGNPFYCLVDLRTAIYCTVCFSLEAGSDPIRLATHSMYTADHPVAVDGCMTAHVR